ncbi:MAG: biliverdin-producing heme oxygenase [Pseudomonadota bacterium]
MNYVKPCDNLRQTLREATADAHDRLDGTMRAVAGWTTLADYTRFLTLQYCARLPVEAWLEAHAPDDLRPPEQCSLIALDLGALGVALPSDMPRFDPPRAPGGVGDAKHSSALGTAWVLAGSSLGNRAILAEIRRLTSREGWPAWPAHFLGDARMLEFWRGLRTQIEDSAETETVLVAIQSASLVFDHFIAHADTAQEALKQKGTEKTL